VFSEVDVPIPSNELATVYSYYSPTDCNGAPALVMGYAPVCTGYSLNTCNAATYNVSYYLDGGNCTSTPFAVTSDVLQPTCTLGDGLYQTVTCVNGSVQSLNNPPPMAPYYAAIYFNSYLAADADCSDPFVAVPEAWFYFQLDTCIPNILTGDNTSTMVYMDGMCFFSFFFYTYSHNLRPIPCHPFCVGFCGLYRKCH
jgi:hypothetical protein